MAYPNDCDTDRGPCACGAWHVMPAAEPSRLDRLMTEPTVLDTKSAPKTLLRAAKDLRAAQKDYMNLRDRPAGDAIREFAGIRVAEEAAELDRAIEATERRMAPVQKVTPISPIPPVERKRCATACRPACDGQPHEICFEDECVAMPRKPDGAA